jgi:aspartyl-tRNA(Asn)/glutamyl-tRNA(Gln) amidotransferase subunit A
MAWTAEDCALLLDVLAAPERSGATGYHAGIERDVKGVRVGVLRHFYEIDRRASEPQIAAMDAALDVLAQLGAEVRAIETAPLADWHAAGFLILLAEAYACYGPALRAQPERFGAIMRDRLAMGAFISAKDRDAATHRREELAAGLRAMTQDVDILATVSQPGEAPLLDRVSKWDGFGTPGYNIPFNMTGDPALSICCGFGPSGLPLGIQLAAKRGADALLLRVAHAYERTTEWRARRPALLG